MELRERDKRILLEGAREAILQNFKTIPHTLIDYNFYPKLREPYGAFVTLNEFNQLRGCIGYIVSEMPLYETVRSAAVQAAFNDPRFRPVLKDELNDIEIEISVLSIPLPITSYDEIEIGKHGIILDYSGHRSVLLPQVAVHYNYTKDQFLSALFDKAGLNSHLWEKEFIPLSIFEANVFSEKEMEKQTND